MHCEKPSFVIIGLNGEFCVVDEKKFIGGSGLYTGVVSPIAIPSFKAYAPKGRARAKQLNYDFTCGMPWGEAEAISAGGWFVYNLTVGEICSCANESFDKGTIYVKV